MTTSQDAVLEALKDAGAILHGHFQLTSGRHSDTYVQCARVLEDPALTTELAEAMAGSVSDRKIDLVAAPAVGGIIIGFAVAQALGVKFIFSERQNGVMTFRRSFTIDPGARVLVVEDVVTTGGSVAEVIDLVQAAGGEAVAVTSIIDRGGEKAFTAELLPLLRLEVESVEPGECPQCAAGTPIDSPGSRRLG
ncbi:MAG: orotate phosphoribosyltransferase [Coriobacteriia bacterium]|nr:orotate phosphoribosyltransferase [Coriobacteriia bacterium]MBN2841009.1 orotate phosphoribosyltransferase [Coriobacteriia bacterium]